MSSSTYKPQLGYFSHDNDPENWEFRAVTLPRLDLLDGDFAANGTSTDSTAQAKPWERFREHVRHLNEQGQGHKQYKMFYLIRYGEGVHNVKEQEVSHAEWNVSSTNTPFATYYRIDIYSDNWAKQPNDSEKTWEDAELVSKSEEQARELAQFWTRSFPKSIKSHRHGPNYSSPLRRCLRTASLAFEPLIRQPGTKSPMIRRETARERETACTTATSEATRSWIEQAYPAFYNRIWVFSEDDELWKADWREILEESMSFDVRSCWTIFFNNDDGEFVALVAHSEAMMALFGATGWKKIPVRAGAAYPLFVCREKVD